LRGFAIDFELKIAQRFLVCLADSVGQKCVIKDRPNPPDFLFSIGDTETWLELSDIYLSDEQARFLNRSEEKVFKFEGSADETALRMFTKLKEKLAKPSYNDAFARFGPGILLLTCQDVVFGSVDLARIADGLYSFSPFEDRGFFKRAYFEYLLDGQRVYRVVYPRDEALADWANAV
jgi:hypothetical protein